MSSCCRWLFLALLLVACTAGEGPAAPSVRSSVALVQVAPLELIEGDSVELRAVVLDVAGSELTGIPVRWAVVDPGVVALDDAHRLVALAPGTTAIRAEVAGRFGSAAVVVRRADVATVSIEPGSLELETGAEAELLAVARDERGRVLADRAVAWSSSDPAVAAVDDLGVVEALAPGHARITATVEGASASAEVQVPTPPPFRLRIDPASVKLAIGEELALDCEALLIDGSPATDAPIRFITSDPAIATVDAAGRVYAVAKGLASIGAVAGPVSAFVPVEVEELTVASVEVIAPAREVIAGEKLALSAIARDPAGRVVHGKAVSWRAGSSTLSVDAATGVVTGRIQGPGIVTATVGSVRGSIGLHVREWVERIYVRGVPTAIVTGESFTFSTEVFGNGGSPLSQPVAVENSDPSVLAQVNAGSFAGIAPGTSTLRFTAEDVTVELPVLVETVFFASVVTGPYRTCGLDLAGSTWCWGLFLGTFQTSAAPRRIATPAPFVELTLGDSHLCGRTAAGEVYCTGLNQDGQLGNGTFLTPTGFVLVQANAPFISISAGSSYTCGVTVDGKGLCWGRNERGQLGIGDMLLRPLPTEVAGGHTFLRIHTTAAGDGWPSTCGVTTTGEALCWGDNSFGQLGDGTTTPSSVPVPVAGDHLFADVAVHSMLSANGGIRSGHTCGITLDGSAFCWGSNSAGQLGDGTTQDSAVPVPVSGGLRFAEIDPGGVGPASFTCGRTTTGEVWCWGNNSAGQLGIPGTTPHTSPVQVVGAGLTDSLSVAFSHACAREIGGPLRCWGRNDWNQLGTGGAQSGAPPLPVIGQP